MGLLRSGVLAVAAALAACLAVFGAWAGAAPANAQTAPAGSASIQVDANVAQVDFGNEIRFQLRARSDDPIRSVLFLYQVDDSPVQNTGVPGYQPGGSVVATYQWRVANVLVPGTKVRYQWQVETVGGKISTTTEQSVVYNDTRFNWRELQGDQITVSYQAADVTTAQMLLDEARKTVQRLSREFGLTLDKPLRVYAYTRQQDYVTALAAARPTDVAMTIGADRIFVLAPGGTSNLTVSLKSVRREVANAIFLQKTQNPYADAPLWLATGFGPFIGGEEISAQNYKTLGQFAAANRLLPLKTLNSNFPSSEDEQTLAYFESLSVVKFISDTYGPEKLRAFFTAIKDGNTVDDSVRKGLGISLDQLETRWKNALKSGAAARSSASPSGQNATGQRGGPPVEIGDGPIDRLFGPAILYWQGVFGAYTRPVVIGGAAFLFLGVLAAIGSAVFGTIRRANAED
jgi:hypothetical protein